MIIKYLTLITSFSTLFIINLLAQNPTITNVTFTQRTDGSHIVDIHYDVQNTFGNSMTVTMEVSDDNGTAWTFDCNNVTGNIGSGITSGTYKHIIWNFGTEHPQTFGDQFRLKIIATDQGGGLPCPGEPTVLYEGKTYNTVLIGSQCWLRENLNVGTMILGVDTMFNNNIIEKYCYDNLETNCTTYGGLYQWNEAMQYVLIPGTQGICPSGWHLPILAELQVLTSFVGGDGNALKAVGQGSGSGAGTNTSGFFALLAGQRNTDGLFDALSYGTVFWSSTPYYYSYNWYAYHMNLYYISSTIHIHYFGMEYGFSVRCLR